jgi:hypothetical protein
MWKLNGEMIIWKYDYAPCSLNGADTPSFKPEQNYFLTQFSLLILLDWFF